MKVWAHPSHWARKLRALRDAGGVGIRRDHWRQSVSVVPTLIEEGLAVVERRTEEVEYLVLTDKGRRELERWPQ